MEILLSSVVHDNTHVQQQTRGLLPETCPCYYTWDIVVAAMSQGPGYYVCIHRDVRKPFCKKAHNESDDPSTSRSVSALHGQ